ncbi:hypothetical protein ACS3SW_04755 [Roseobacteraceae bacterium S113]
MLTSYTLAPDGVITHVGGEWDRFALENDGPMATAQHVLGRPLLDFVEGLDTRSYLNALFFWAKTTRAPVKLSYQCNDETYASTFDMTIVTDHRGGLHVSHKLRASIALVRPHAVLAEGDITSSLKTCSICGEIAVSDQTIDAAAAARFTVCMSCKAKADRAMGSQHLESSLIYQMA